MIIEDRGPLSLLFLNNNYHVIHHIHPRVPWYKLPYVAALFNFVFMRWLLRDENLHDTQTLPAVDPEVAASFMSDTSRHPIPWR